MRVFVFIYIFASIILSSCVYIDIPPKYNPEKAGVSIVESYNISGYLNTTFQEGVYHDDYSDLAIYGDKIYILAEGIINVFQKNNFKKLNEIQVVILNKPDDDSKIQYRELVMINEERGFISCSLRYIEDAGYSDVYSLISVNIKTGDAELLDMNKVDIQNEEEIEEMGYDKIHNYFWLWTSGSFQGEVYFYTFDALNNKFVFSKKIKHIDSGDMFDVSSLFINGDEWFYTGYWMGRWRPMYVAAVKYNVNRPGERLYFIDMQYLNVSSSDILYDEPYVWMLVNKDDKIQMLKLLPNEEN